MGNGRTGRSLLGHDAGGQYVNNWRMAELRREARTRPRARGLGAMFDRTADGKVLQRNFGHRYPRLAHVGDRTGLEMIRTLQDYGIHQGIGAHGVLIIQLLKDGDRVVGAFGYEREQGGSSCSGPGASCWRRRRRPRVQDYEQQLGIYRRWPHARLRCRRRARGHGFVQFHPTGMIWPACEAPRDRGRRGEGASSRTRRPTVHVRRHPDNYKNQTPTTRTGWRYTQVQGRQASAGIADADHVSRCINREVSRPWQSPRRRVPRHRVDQGEDSERARAHRRSCWHVSPVRRLADLDITRSLEVGPTHYIMGGVSGRRRRPRTCPGCCRGRVRGRHRGRPSGRQLAVRHHRVRQARRRRRRQVCEGAEGATVDAAGGRGRAKALEPERNVGRGSVRGSTRRR